MGRPNICFLYYSDLFKAVRPLKIINSLVQYYNVHVILGCSLSGDKRKVLDEKVSVHIFKPKSGLQSLINHHVLIHREFGYLVDRVKELAINFQLVISEDYPTLYAGYRIARHCKCPLIYDVAELYLETINQFYPQKSNLLKTLTFKSIISLVPKIGKRIEGRILEDIAVVSCTTTNRSYASYLKQAYNVDADVLYNCPLEWPNSNTNYLRTRFKISKDSFVVLYQGLYNSGRGLENLVRAFRLLPDNIYLVMVGYGMLEDDLKKLVEQESLMDKVYFHDSIAYKELYKITNSADLGVLILQPSNLSKKLASANKIFEYMASGLPILATDLPENRRILDEVDSGYLLKNSLPEYIAEEILKISRLPDENAGKAKRGRDAFTNVYNWSEQEKKLFLIVNDLVA